MAKPTVEDRIAIEDLFIKYTTSLDACHTEAIVECFTEDCSLSTPILGDFKGHDGIREWMKPNVWIKENGGQLRHVISNMIVDVSGDTAKAHFYLLDFLTMGGKPELLSPGVYDLDLVKQDGRWLMSRRVVRMDYNFTLPGPGVGGREVSGR